MCTSVHFISPEYISSMVVEARISVQKKHKSAEEGALASVRVGLRTNATTRRRGNRRSMLYSISEGGVKVMRLSLLRY